MFRIYNQTLMRRLNQMLILLSGLLIVTSCSVDELPAPDVAIQYMLGGETTIYSSGPDAFTFPLPNLDEAGLAEHFLSDAAFEQQFVSAPAEQFGGLGPVYNHTSCNGCHVRNGRSSIPQFAGDPMSGLLLRLSVPGFDEHGGPLGAPGFGGQLQNKSIYGVQAEGTIAVSEEQKIMTYADGSSVILTHPTYSIADAYMALPENLMISPRNAPPVFGLGLLEAITEAEILSHADPADQNGDGVSGHPNTVYDPYTHLMQLGRFGWKAESPSAKHQSEAAAHNDMGLTTPAFPIEHCDGQSNCTEGLQDVVDVDDATIELFAHYFQTLAVPAQRNYNDPQVKKGAVLFEEIGCGACHISTYTTGVHPIASLSYQTIHPYTDLLLHDMGDDLADHRPAYAAGGTEWRTAPLWGIGLTQVVNTRATFLHDGRAKTIEEAILWHGGESLQSRNAFMQLSAADRQALIAFLNSL